jgi:integrase
MPRLNKGVVKQGNDGFWYGRVRWTDETTGKPREKKFPPMKTKTEADKLVENFKKDLNMGGGSFVDAERMKFTQLAKTYQEKKLFPAKVVGGRKVGGVKSVAPVLNALKALEEYFGNRKIRTIKHAEVESYKLHRLDTPTHHGKQRQISSVNRELELLRAMLRFAVRQGWLTHSPFEMGDPLISKADETRRERTLSRDEEKKLLAACTGRRSHLRPLIITALDTACRRGELFKLRWRDVDFASRTLTVVAENSKTARARTIGMTPRVYDELVQLWNSSPQNTNDSVFGYDKPNSTVKTAFAAALSEAGIEGLRWHDLRHTGITRMVDTKQPTAVIMKVSGHTQHPTFARYVNPNTEAITNIAEALGALHNKADEDGEASEAIN